MSFCDWLISISIMEGLSTRDRLLFGVLNTSIILTTLYVAAVLNFMTEAQRGQCSKFYDGAQRGQSHSAQLGPHGQDLDRSLAAGLSTNPSFLSAKTCLHPESPSPASA